MDFYLPFCDNSFDWIKTLSSSDSLFSISRFLLHEWFSAVIERLFLEIFFFFKMYSNMCILKTVYVYHSIIQWFAFKIYNALLKCLKKTLFNRYSISLYGKGSLHKCTCIIRFFWQIFSILFKFWNSGDNGNFGWTIVQLKVKYIITLIIYTLFVTKFKIKGMFAIDKNKKSLSKT